MTRLLFLLVALLALADGARAQTPAQKPNAVPAITADQARVALDVLNDPKKRAAFAATLDAIVKAQPPPAAPSSTPLSSPTPSPAPATAQPARETPTDGLSLPLEPNSLGAQVLMGASDFINRAGHQAMDALRTVQSLPLLYGWAVVMATNPMARDVLTDIAWRVALALLCAFTVEYLLRRALRRPMSRLNGGTPMPTPTGVAPPPPAVEAMTELTDGPSKAQAELAEARAELGDLEPPPLPQRLHQAAPRSILKRLPHLLARLVLELAPAVGMAIVGHLIAGSSLGGQTASRLVILAVVDASVVCTALLSLARLVLASSPNAPAIMPWVRRFVLIAVIGYMIGEVGLLLGLSVVAHDALQKTVGLILHLLAVALVLRNRRGVRRWLCAAPEAKGGIATLRNRFAAIWHWAALFALGASWLLWVAEMEQGYATLLRYAGLTVLLIVGARLALAGITRFLDRSMRVHPATAERYPGLEPRLRAYFPVALTVARTAIYLLAAFALMQLYGLGAFTWLFGSFLGQRVVSAVGTLTVTIVLAFAVWEGVNAAFQRHLAVLQREAQIARSARLRTLFPLLRTTLLVTIVVVAGLMILSEIGVNIAPLLAGAGIVGVAIGFGSQKLVQDLITGIFLLLENAMQVGDTVTVSGLTGTVEALSVRTIHLRAGDGSVHIIPFSAVTSVTNLNRGLGNAAISVTVSYDEDTDKVSEAMQAIVVEMREDPAFTTKMLSDLHLWGIDKIDGTAVTIAGQVVCTDTGRWSVQREFNRRMKLRFQETGIKLLNQTRFAVAAA